MYVPESDTEVLEICRLPLGSTVKLPPDTQQKCDDVRFPDTHTHAWTGVITCGRYSDALLLPADCGPG